MPKANEANKALKTTETSSGSGSSGSSSGGLSQKDFKSPKAVQLLNDLKEAILKPHYRLVQTLSSWTEAAGDGMTPAEIGSLLKQYVANLSDQVCVSSEGQEVLVLQELVRTYRKGPSAYTGLVSKQLAQSLRRSLAMINTGTASSQLSAGCLQALCRGLVDATKASSQSQARAVELLAEALAGGSHFECEVHMVAMELREEALDAAVALIHPPNGNLKPHQIAQLTNLYRERLGLSDVAFDTPDNPQEGLPRLHPIDDVKTAFSQALRPEKLIQACMEDLQKPSGEQHRFEHHGLCQWISNHNGLRQDITEAQTIQSKLQELLNPDLWLEIVHKAMVPKEHASSSSSST